MKTDTSGLHMDLSSIFVTGAKHEELKEAISIKSKHANLAAAGGVLRTSDGHDEDDERR